MMACRPELVGKDSKFRGVWDGRGSCDSETSQETRYDAPDLPGAFCTMLLKMEGNENEKKVGEIWGEVWIVDETNGFRQYFID